MSLARSPDGRLRRTLCGLAVGGLIGLLGKELQLGALLSYWHDPAPIVVLLAALGGGAFLTRLRPLVGASAGALALVWLAVAFTPLSARLAVGLERRDPAGPSDAIFVLSSGLQLDGEPTVSAESRLDHGIELLAQHRAPRLILSEIRRTGPSYADWARGRLDRLGIRGEVVDVGVVGNTHDEAVAVAAWCRARGLERVLLVTSPTHALRAALAFEHQGLEVRSSPSVETRFDLQSLRQPQDRLAAFGNLLHERIGLWVYRRRGWIAPGS